MTDPPPKKFGSLRDRIAAFENKGGAPPGPAPAPAPRPKPGNLTWQPKPASTPASPKRDTDEGESGAGNRPGMSAADAKESIGKLSLKERMAALQGSTAFGGGAPPPRPTGEKPKWKPPPVVQRVEPIGGGDEEKEKEEPVPAIATSPSEDVEKEAGEEESPHTVDETKHDEAGEEQKEKEYGEPDPEEEERQRRAALAARMARLGGARVGMGPPIFGKKPDLPPKRKSTKDEEKPKAEEKPDEEEVLKEEQKTVDAEGASATTEIAAPEVVVSPTLQEAAATELPPSTAEDSATQGSGDYFTVPEKQHSASSTLSPESATSPPVRSPAMPVPLGPKRAAPPRKRAAKSPARPPPPVAEQELHDSPSSLGAKDKSELADQKPDQSPAEAAEPQGDRQPEVTESQVDNVVEKAVDDVAVPESKVEVTEEPTHSPEAPTPATHEEAHELDPELESSKEPIVKAPSKAVSASEQEVLESQEKEEIASDPTVEKDEPQSEEPAAEPEASVAEPEEEDEAARRKRIAERLARSGGFNPFAGGMPPPLRRDSAESARSPPPPVRRDSHPSIVRSPPLPVRRDSRPDDSARSPASIRRDSQQDVAQSPSISAKPELPERKASVGSVQSIVEGPARKASLDGGVSNEPRVSDYEHEHEQSTPPHDVHAQAIMEAVEDEDEATEARGDREFVHERLAEDEEREPYEDSEDHRFSRETKDEPETIEEEANEPSVQSPPPPLARRPLPTPPVATIISNDDAGTVALSPPPPPRRDFPPPPVRVAVPPPPPHAPPVDEEDIKEERVPSPEPEGEDAYTKHAREVGLEHEDEEHVSRAVEEEDEYVYHGGHEEASIHDDAGHDAHGREEFVPPPPPLRHAAVPPPPPLVDEEEEEEAPEEEEEPVPPPPPRRSSTHPPPVRAPPPDDDEDVLEIAEFEDNAEEQEPAPPPPPPRHPRPIFSIPTPLDVSGVGKPAPPTLRRSTQEQEILDDSDGDPIDPAFYSPRSPGTQKSAGWGSLPSSSPASSPPPQPPAQLVSPPPAASPPLPPQRVISPPPPPQRVVSPPIAPERDAFPPYARSPPPPPVSTRPDIASPASEQPESKEDEVDAEQARRRTIAERMAKLGGIRFGAPPPVPAVRRPAPALEHEGEHEGEEDNPIEAEETSPADEEEDEFARKQRIAARIAGMGGMRFGMLPGAPAPKPAPRVHREEEDESVMSPPPPKRSAPVPPAPPAAEDEDEREGESDYQHVSDSDGAGHEESELEEVTYTDADEDVPPPPVPDRGTRRASTGPPPVPQGFASPPPVPRSRPPPPSSFGYPPPPHAPPPPTTQETQGDFVLVDQAENTDEPPPPPPPRAARPPARAPPGHQAGEASSIPSIDFGGETDLSLSGQWSEDSTSYPPTTPGKSPVASIPSEPPTQPPAPNAPVQPRAEQHLTPDELQTHWGRVGVQVHEISAAFYEKSKKSVVGDGSYRGFVNTVLSHVPNAAQPTDSLDSFGYLVYSQSAAAVHRRVSDIMPGDVAVVYDAKFKGHKGLQSYHQSVGVGEPLVGIVGDFESKKSKVKVYQANQHVGQQSVESVSYRLEDLKSGSVKIFRVLEA